MDEVIRAYLCQFACISTLAALPALGFFLRLITLYLLRPFFPAGEEELDPEKRSPLVQLAGALAALSSKNAIGKNIKTVSMRLLPQVGIHTLSHQAPRCAAAKWALLRLYLSLAFTMHQVFKFTTFHKH